MNRHEDSEEEGKYQALQNLLQDFMDQTTDMVSEKSLLGIQLSMSSNSDWASQELMQANGILEVITIALEIFQGHLPRDVVRPKASQKLRPLLVPGRTFVVDRSKENH